MTTTLAIIAIICATISIGCHICAYIVTYHRKTRLADWIVKKASRFLFLK